MTYSPTRLTYTVTEASALLGLSRNATYMAIRRNQIPSVRIGRRLVIPRQQLERTLLCMAAADSPRSTVNGMEVPNGN
ncbi:MAG: helix-turn-helix domain-containing protein [Acidobacteriales bacterium]|nr:helix-turn-helix domain-containing protein [Terriglobales bacterium]